MKPTRQLPPLFALAMICLVVLSQGCSAASLSGVATATEPDWYKISINSQETINLQVNANDVTGSMTLGVALTLGIDSNFGNTKYVAATTINSTNNATITYMQVDTTPLYLTVFFITDENSSVAIDYNITSSHPIITYSYGQYYNDVVFPDIVTKTALVGLLIGSIATIVTVYFLRRRRKERLTSLL